MRQPNPIFLLWPGLSGLIRYGRAGFLIIALGFASIADTVLFCTCFWTEWLETASKFYLLAGLILTWGVLSAAAARLSLYFDRQIAYDLTGDRFLRLLDDYLAGHWAEAERIAEILLKRNRRDPETLLLLATLRRHTGDLLRAAETLERLERLQEADRWRFEIAAEKAALQEAILEAAEAETDGEAETDRTAETETEAERDVEIEAERDVDTTETILPFPEETQRRDRYSVR